MVVVVDTASCWTTLTFCCLPLLLPWAVGPRATRAPRRRDSLTYGTLGHSLPTVSPEQWAIDATPHSFATSGSIVPFQSSLTQLLHTRYTVFVKAD